MPRLSFRQPTEVFGDTVCLSFVLKRIVTPDLLFTMIAAAPELKKSHSLDWSSEHRLIFACARCQPDAAQINHILDNFGQTLDWGRFVQIVSWHGVLPLAYRNLSTLVPHRIPKPVLTQLLKLYLINSSHNQRLTAALQELVSLFNLRGIPIVFFKGPVLAEMAYGSIHLRRFSDIDLLVREEDVPTVRQILISQGFQTKDVILATLQSSHPSAKKINGLCDTSKDFINRDLISEDASYSGEEAFIHKERFITVDLHWQLMPSFFPVAFDLNQIWLTRQPVVVEHFNVESLNAQDLLLYLCAHGSKELWRNLIWVCDVAEVVRVHPDLPWFHLWQRSKAMGMERMFLLGLGLAHNLLEMPLPSELQKPVLAHTTVQDLVEVFKRRIFTDIEVLLENRETGFWLFHNPLHLKMRDRLRDRLPQYWLTLRFTITPNQEDQQFLALPKVLYPLHYLVRPIRIFYKWIILRKQSAKGDRQPVTPL
jgi:hypothetical protein